jgi:hypothetical protein
MTDYYTSLCFGVRISAVDATLLREVEQVCADLADGPMTPEQEAKRYAETSPAFRDLFPVRDSGLPFAGVRALFQDPDYPVVSADLIYGIPMSRPASICMYRGIRLTLGKSPTCSAWWLSCLPFRFGYACTASRMHHDSQSGGEIEVRSDKIIHLSDVGEDVDAHPLVIAAVQDQGLSFWNAEWGWSDLHMATVFKERDRANATLPIHEPPAVWMQLPPRHAYFEVLS